MSVHVKLTLAVALVVLGALGAVFLFVDSDERAIEKLLEEGAAAARRGDAEGVIAVVSRRYRAGDEDYGAVCERIRRAVEERAARVVKVRGAAVDVDGDEARAEVTLEASVGARRFGQQALTLELRREEEGWRVTSARLR